MYVHEEELGEGKVCGECVQSYCVFQGLHASGVVCLEGCSL